MTWWTSLLVPGLGCLAVAGWQWRRLLRGRREEREAAVLQALARGGGGLFGLDLMAMTGLGSGALYPILARLEVAGRVSSYWCPMPSGKYRRVYRLVPEPEPPWRPLSTGRAAAPPDEPGGAA